MFGPEERVSRAALGFSPTNAIRLGVARDPYPINSGVTNAIALAVSTIAVTRYAAEEFLEHHVR